MSSTERLKESSKRLDETRRTALETEDIAIGTLAELRKQREQLQGTRKKVDQVDANLNESNKTINSMNSGCVVC
jgi:vesicle transport through interaction with t-SNAREs protein 1